MLYSNVGLDKEGCEYIGSVATFDIWLTPRQDLLLQHSADASNNACLPLVAARKIKSIQWQSAVAIYDLQRELSKIEVA